MKTKLGSVLEIRIFDDGRKQVSIKTDDGEWALFWSEFGGFSKTLKQGQRVKVWFKYSNFLNSTISYKCTKIKEAA